MVYTYKYNDVIPIANYMEGCKMQKKKSARRQWSSLYYCFVLVSCLALLSSCTFSTANNSPDAAKPQAKILSSVTKSADPVRDKAQAILAKMSLDNKITQMIMVEFIGTDYVATGLQQMVAQQQVGGVLYQPTIGSGGDHNFDPPNNTLTSISAYSAQIVADEKVAPLIAIDEEGGEVDKISQQFPASPSAEELAQSGDLTQTYNQAKLVASELKQLGINVDLAPVVDVGPIDPVTYGHRRFSTDPAVVTRYASAFLRGLQDNGIPGALKHFPGLGDTDQNPHTEKVVITRSMQDLQSIDLLPYQKIIQSDNPAMVMTTDVLMQAMDPNQLAEVSPKVIGYLRNTLHFNGVIITDGLYMDGLYDYVGPDGPTNDQLIQAGIQTINAGNDLIEGPSNAYEVQGIVSGIEAEIQQGKLSQSQIDQSVMRILMMKINYGIIK